MRALFFLVFIGVFSVCQRQDKPTFEIGEEMVDTNYLTKPIFSIISSGQIKQCYQVFIHGVTYLFSRDNHRKINYIQTADTTFQTTEKVKIGMSFNEVKLKSRNSLQLESGWAFFVPLSSGWNAAFEISNYDKSKMSTDSTVKWLFKRK